MANPRSTRADPGNTSGPDSAFEPVDTTEHSSQSSRGGFSLELIYFALFRHKWKIVICSLLGIAASIVAFKTTPRPYYSQARILISYVEEAATPLGLANDSSIKRTDPRGDKILSTETSILTSHDLAVRVVEALGTKAILGNETESPTALTEASLLLNGNLSVNLMPWSSVVILSFHHDDPQLVRKVLSQYVKSYLALHAEIHRVSYDEVLVQETDQLRSKLLQTEEELRGMLQRAGVVSVPEAKTAFSAQSARLQTAIMELESDLAGSKATLAALTGTQPSVPADEASSETPIPADKLDTYEQVTTRLETLRRREQELLLQFTAETSPVKGVRAQIVENEGIKSRLEKEYPQIVTQRRVRPLPASTSQASTFDPVSEAARIVSIETRLKVMTEQLARVRSDATTLANLETSISEIERRKEMLERQYRLFSENLERNRINQELGAGRVSNIKVLEEPTPPMRDSTKLKKLMMMLAGGGLALGIGLAFAIELFLDQSVRRSSEVEGTLGLPLVLTIPRIKHARAMQKTGSVPLLSDGGPRAKGSEPNAEGSPSTVVGHPSSDSAAVTPWSADHQLREFFDALRNRLVYNFEMRGITRKPKLVAVTSCGPDSGVSTIAAGLAASLSETGDGNVLLVDMNPDRKTPQHFHKGDLKMGLTEVLAEGRRDDALIGENLYMVSQQTADDRLSWVIPKRFAQMVPKMKASDYDYIIFDLPPVSQISATPQLARFMDQVLMVVESEKTSRDAVKRAGAMLSEAGATVGVVLNKTRSYVPRALDHDALAS